MIALLLTLAAQGPLTPELLVDHPGLREGHYEEVREDWLRALEDDPESEWATACLLSIDRLEPFCARPLDMDRLGALRPRLTDGRARFELALMHRDAIRRRTFSDELLPRVAHEDLGYVESWFALGPYGALDAPWPLWSPGDDDAPHATWRTRYSSPIGTLEWRPVAVEKGDFYPQETIHPQAGGVVYLLAWVEADLDEAILEVDTHEAVQIYWNGELAGGAQRGGLTQAEYHVRAAVRFADGPNGLVLRMENGSVGWLSVRVFDARGRVVEGAIRALDDLGEAPREWPSHGTLPELPTPEPRRGFGRIAEMIEQIANWRADLALAAGEPADPAQHEAWLALRHRAVLASSHLPAEVHRRFQLEIEERLEGLGSSFPEIEYQRARRLLEEDQPLEAHAITTRLVEDHPRVPAFRHAHRDALLALDSSGVLARAATRDAVRDLEDPASLRILAGEAYDRNDPDLALELGKRAARRDGRDDSGYAGFVLDLLTNGTEEQMREGFEWIDRLRATHPSLVDFFDGNERVLHENLGEDEQVLARRMEMVGRFPQIPSVWIELGNFYLERDRIDDARAPFQAALQLDPGNETVRDLLTDLGIEDEADEFFREFAPDRDEAIAASADIADTPTALVLDSRMVFVRPDSSSHTRTHQITRALDRTGTELLHQAPVDGETLVARVVNSDGRIFEPVVVDDSWVMPSLDPGDSVEFISDTYTPSQPGVAPQLDAWFFESFDQPFIISRYVLFLPGNLEGRLEFANFEGTHEEVPWRNGTVHVFETRDSARLEQEVDQPSDRELRAWLQYGDDLELDHVVQWLRHSLSWQSDVAADIELELRELVDTLRAQVDPDKLAPALYDAVTAHVLDFSGDGDTTDVWALQRGNPIGLLAALYELAGIEFEWAAPYPSRAPELHPSPAEPFDSWNDLGPACLRLGGPEDDDPTWLFVLARGVPFGRYTGALGGSRMLVLGESEARFEELPRTEDPHSSLDITIRVQPDKSARVEASWTLGDLLGPVQRQQLSQAEPQMRDQFIRAVTSQIVTGITLDQWEIVDVERLGADLVVEFTGTIERFVRGSSRKPWCKLPWPALRTSRSFGNAERVYPLVFRSYESEVSRIRVELGDAWTFADEPVEVRAERDGFWCSVEQQHPEPGVLIHERRLGQRGAFLAPDEVPEFAIELKKVEDADGGKINLKPTE